MKMFKIAVTTFLFIVFFQKGIGQDKINTNTYASAFAKAYNQYPAVPKGILEAIAYTNTRINHIIHSNDELGSCTGLPKSYGVMGLMLDGKNVFRNNLKTVSSVSGYTENEIIESPEKNILAFAKAYSIIKNQKKIATNRIENQKSILITLSELPENDIENNFPLNAHIYSVLKFLEDASYQALFNFPAYQINYVEVFGEENLKIVSSSIVNLAVNPKQSNKKEPNPNSRTQSADYAPALWAAASTCNYTNGRTLAISAVTIHDTEGSYASTISWFQNCAAVVSAHYVVRSSDGQVTQMVLEANKAYHVGSENGYTIGIEHEGYCSQTGWYTNAMYTASAGIVKDVCNSGYGINPLRTYFGASCTCSQSSSTCQKGGCIKVKGHQMYPSQTHADPGPNWDWEKYYKLVNDNPTITTFSDISGNFYDSGGATGNCTDDERNVYVFNATCGGQVSINFSFFNLETNWDYLFIYNGNNVNAPLLGKYTGTTSPGIITSTTGSLCVEFRSDCATTSQGWAATYNCSGSLPVNLFSWNANIVSKSIVVNWKVAQELNMNSYEIERSFDGINFSKIGKKYAVNSPSPYSYQYSDSNVLTSYRQDVFYYRLKQIENNGNSKYSATILVKRNSVEYEIQPVQNIFSSNIFVRANMQKAEKINFTLFDATGRLYYSKQLLLNDGFSNIVLDGLGNLSKGLYFLKIEGEGNNAATHKVFKN